MAKTKNTQVPKNDYNVDVFAPVKKSEDKNAIKAPDLSVLNNWLTFSMEAARKKQWEFFVIDQFLRGNHNVRGNAEDNTLEITKRTDTVAYPINKIFSTFRAVRGYVTRHRPVVKVEPDDSSNQQSIDYARRATKLLERDNKLNQFNKINKEWVYYGVKYGVGWRQVGYDQAKKVALRWTIDPFDLLIGAKTGKMEDAPYVIKTFTRTIAYWKNKFPDANVTPDNEIAASEYKKLSLQLQYQDTASATQNLEEQTAVGYECWYRVFSPNSKRGLVNKVIYTKNEIVHFEETPYTEYPFIAYESEIMPNETYPDGHLKHVIAPQRMLNLLNTQLLEYNHIVNRGRFLKEKNAGFKVISAKEGQIIEHNPGKSVQVLNPPGVNPLLERQLNMALDFIEDIGGQHDASIGATPARVSSGDAIEALQTGDSNNITDLRDNFEDSLSKEAAFILKCYSLFEKDGVVITDATNPEKVDRFGAVGAKAYEFTGSKMPEKYYIEDNGSYCDICGILPDNQVNTSVSSQLGETRAARLDLMLRLVDKGLPLKVLLEHLEFPNSSDILQRIAEESVADMAMEAMKAQASAPQDQGMGDVAAVANEMGGMAGGGQ